MLRLELWRSSLVGNSAYAFAREVALRLGSRLLYNQTQVWNLVDTQTPIWSLAQPCDKTILSLEHRLQIEGVRLLRTFDLEDARLGFAECGCPHHGTEDCDCKMTIFLAYLNSNPPVTLVVHGNDGRSWVSIIDRPGQRADFSVVAAIRHALAAEIESAA